MHKQTYRYEAIKYPSNEDVFFNVLWHNRDYTAPHWHNGLEILYLLEGVKTVIWERKNASG